MRNQVKSKKGQIYASIHTADASDAAARASSTLEVNI